MKKIIIIAATVLTSSFAANAQLASTTAQQSINLVLANAIDMTFTANGNATGPLVSMPFNTVSDYANGVTSSAQALKVRSNRGFNVTVKTSAANFTYTGPTAPAPVMPVASILDVKVTANGTGGTTAAAFTGYGDLSATAQNLITGASNGNNQTFSVMYQATPGFAYTAGTYAVDVIYTATQQ